MKRPQETPAWTEDVRKNGTQARDRFLEAHLTVVRYAALRISGRLPASVDLDDLIHDGVLGLMDAVERFDPSRGIAFRSYADSRIQGAILDGLRRKDWRPRSVRSNQRCMDEAMSSLASAQNRPPTEDEVAKRMGVDLAAYRSMLIAVRGGPLLSLDELESSETVLGDETMRPDLDVEHQDLLQALSLEIQQLPERERYILDLYYRQELNLKEIGAILGVTESRVCQLHSQAASRLRVALRRRLHPSSTPSREVTRR